MHWIVSSILNLMVHQKGALLSNGTNVSMIKSFPSGGLSSETRWDKISNLTKILDTLLMDYDNKFRPDLDTGKPTNVWINMNVRSMGPISEQDMSYSMDCYFRQTWKDSRLRFSGTEKTLSLGISMLDKIWKPDTYFWNGAKSYLHKLTTANKFVRLSQDGTVYFSSRLTIKAKCPMNLARFPLDYQVCPLVIGSYAYRSNEIIFQWEYSRGKEPVSNSHLSMSQFELKDIRLTNNTVLSRDGYYTVNGLRRQRDPVAVGSSYFEGHPEEPKDGTGGQMAIGSADGPGPTFQQLLQQSPPQLVQMSREDIIANADYSTLKVNFILQRHMGYFLINFYAPCTLIVILSWVAFWLNREATADRIALGATSILTMTFIALDSRSDLPRVTYPTALDVYILICYAFLMTCIVEFAVVHSYTKFGTGDPEMQMFEKERIQQISRCGIINNYLRRHRQVPSNAQLAVPGDGGFRMVKCEIGDYGNGSGLSGVDVVGGVNAMTKHAEACNSNSSAPKSATLTFRRRQVSFQSSAGSTISDVHPGIVRMNSLERKKRAMSNMYKKWKNRGEKLDPFDTEINSVSKIDRIARAVFPMTFAFLSMLYWNTYIRREDGYKGIII